jgi:YVTN family beta-propeller protein
VIRHLPSALAILVLVPLLTAAGPAAPGRMKLYVTNSGGNDVTVLDVATGKRLGRIEVGPHPHGIAVPAAQDVVYVTVEGANPGELVAIDPVTDRVTRRMAIGPEPNQLAVTPDGKWAYVPVRDGYWAVVDLAKFEVVKRITTGGRPHNTACSADGKLVFLAPMGSPKKVTVVDAATQEKVAEIPFSNVVRPIAVSRAGSRLYAEVDGLVGFEVGDVPHHKLLYRIPADLSPAQRKVPSRSHGLGVRPDQKELWECDLEHHEVHVYDLTGDRPKQTATVPIGSHVYWLTFRPDGKVCYVACQGPDGVAVVDTETKQVIGRLPAGKAPKRLLVVTVTKEAPRRGP